MSEPLERVRRFWQDHVNNEYFTSHERGSEEYFAEIERRRYRYHYHLPPLFERIGSRQRGERLLEVGCGIGIDTLRLARAGVGEIVGVDLTEVAIEVAAERARRSGGDRVRFEVANDESLPFPDGSFDAVYSFGVLHHTPDVERAVSEVHRVLAPGGVAQPGYFPNPLLHRRICRRLLRSARSRSSTYCQYAFVALGFARLAFAGISTGSRREFVKYPG